MIQFKEEKYWGKKLKPTLSPPIPQWAVWDMESYDFLFFFPLAKEKS